MLDEAKTWAVVGLSGNPRRTAYSIARLLQERGKRIVPIHPDAPTVLGEQGYATLADVPFPIDVVDVFRRSEFAGEFADQAVAIGARAVFFQLGVIDEEAFERTPAAGVPMVMDTCPAIEWRRRGVSAPRRSDLAGAPRARAVPDGLVVPGGRAGGALLPVAGAGWAVGEHHRQPGRARVRRGRVAVPDRRAAPARAAPPRRAARGRSGGGRRLRAPLPAPQPGRRPRAAGGPPPRGRRPAPAAAPPDEADPVLAAPPPGRQAAPRRDQGPARPASGTRSGARPPPTPATTRCSRGPGRRAAAYAAPMPSTTSTCQT